jgi:hypothetical protein
MKYQTLLALALSTALLAACGGGGGGGGTAAPNGPVASTLTFPFLSAINADTATGSSYSLTAVGTAATQATDGLCSGTVSVVSGPATTAATFEGTPALSSTSVVTMTFSNCTPASTTATTMAYFNSNYLPLASSASNGSYSVYSQPLNIPTSITVGSSGVIGTLLHYTDSSKATPDGRTDISFVIEANTANTAIINKISKSYSQASELLYTGQERTRIDNLGRLTRLSLDLQYAAPLTMHLVFRKPS